MQALEPKLKAHPLISEKGRRSVHDESGCRVTSDHGLWCYKTRCTMTRSNIDTLKDDISIIIEWCKN